MNAHYLGLTLHNMSPGFVKIYNRSRAGGDWILNFIKWAPPKLKLLLGRSIYDPLFGSNSWCLELEVVKFWKYIKRPLLECVLVVVAPRELTKFTLNVWWKIEAHSKAMPSWKFDLCQSILFCSYSNSWPPKAPTMNAHHLGLTLHNMSPGFVKIYNGSRAGGEKIVQPSSSFNLAVLCYKLQLFTTYSG